MYIYMHIYLHIYTLFYSTYTKRGYDGDLEAPILWVDTVPDYRMLLGFRLGGFG